MSELRYEYCPPYTGSRVDHVGTYKRTLPVNLDRMYENALDWEHLPHLHASSFKSIECIDAGAWGWRCSVIDLKDRESILELALDRDCRRWITRNLEGPSKGAEIWTHVFVTGEKRMDLVIDFFVPGVPEESRAKVGMAYASAYETLYDEDVWMMSERQNQLERRVDTIRPDELELEINQPLPIKASLSGRDYYVHQHDGQWMVYPQVCPHQLGPLSTEVSVNGTVTCPWHGYAFDLATGACTTGHSCRFGKRPEAIEADGRLKLVWVD